MNKLLPYSVLISFLMLIGCAAPKKFAKVEKPYEPNWESLADFNEEPEWLKDAKFGIYFHWGVYSVPAFDNEWYPRNMHVKREAAYKHHVEKYGHPSVFGYHDFVPMFKAEKFNAKEWIDLFEKAGARFAGPVAEHHDGFSMWDSEITPWNSMDKGPKKDITGELEKEIKARGMKLITTFHHARNLQRNAKYPEAKGGAWNSHYPFYEGMAPSSDDPELKYLYGNIPEDQWHEEVWFGKLKEVIDKYQPDIIWFDSWLEQIPEDYRQKFCAYYLNEAQKLDKEVVIVRKEDDLPLTCSIDDMEKSRMHRIKDQLWMTDETLSTGSWCYTENLEIKPVTDVLHVLIDIVSKNGVLLLNISPKADGTIPQDQQNVLLKMGEWLKSYGESIYETRPWYTSGEGSTKEPEGGFGNHREFAKLKYSNKDIRYTTKGKTIYALVLGAPEAGADLLLKSFSSEVLSAEFSIKKVSMLGSNDKIDWELTEDGLKLSGIIEPADQMSTVFKIDTK
jgi:alpha-L-fucosidase